MYQYERQLLLSESNVQSDLDQSQNLNEPVSPYAEIRDLSSFMECRSDSMMHHTSVTQMQKPQMFQQVPINQPQFDMTCQIQNLFDWANKSYKKEQNELKRQSQNLKSERIILQLSRNRKLKTCKVLKKALNGTQYEMKISKFSNQKHLSCIAKKLRKSGQKQNMKKEEIILPIICFGPAAIFKVEKVQRNISQPKVESSTIFKHHNGQIEIIENKEQHFDNFSDQKTDVDDKVSCTQTIQEKYNNNTKIKRKLVSLKEKLFLYSQHHRFMNCWDDELFDQIAQSKALNNFIIKDKQQNNRTKINKFFWDTTKKENDFVEFMQKSHPELKFGVRQINQFKEQNIIPTGYVMNMMKQNMEAEQARNSKQLIV